jgi:hypothetical protein
MVVDSNVNTLLSVTENGSAQNGREHHVDHVSVMKLNRAYTYMVIYLVLQITIGLGKKEVHITLITCM